MDLEQANEIIQRLDMGIVAAMRDLEGEINRAFYEEDSSYTKGLRAAQKIMQDALRPTAQYIRGLGPVGRS